jgi:hypothetical protein
LNPEAVSFGWLQVSYIQVCLLQVLDNRGEVGSQLFSKKEGDFSTLEHEETFATSVCDAGMMSPDKTWSILQEPSPACKRFSVTVGRDVKPSMVHCIYLFIRTI